MVRAILSASAEEMMNTRIFSWAVLTRAFSAFRAGVSIFASRPVFDYMSELPVRLGQAAAADSKPGSATIKGVGRTPAVFADMKTWTERLGHTTLRSFTDEDHHFWLEQNPAK